MGFEQDYERGWNDRFWGPVFRPLIKGATPEDLAHVAKAPLCAELRYKATTGETESALAILDIFSGHRATALADGQLTLLAPDGPFSGDTLSFLDATSTVCDSEERSGAIPTLCRIAADHLEEAGSNGDIGRCDARTDVLVALYATHIRAKLQLAMTRMASQLRLSPQAVDSHMQRMMDFIPLREIAALVLAGKGAALRAPRCAQFTVDIRRSLLSPAPRGRSANGS